MCNSLQYSYNRSYNRAIQGSSTAAASTVMSPDVTSLLEPGCQENPVSKKSAQVRFGCLCASWSVKLIRVTCHQHCKPCLRDSIWWSALYNKTMLELLFLLNEWSEGVLYLNANTCHKNCFGIQLSRNLSTKKVRETPM